MSLTITEDWIRDRVQLAHDNLEDVRSLSLPGTYQEKIGSLGNALSSFTRLKQIDLSRNALQSLQGLQHLRLLEKLNLYYNNVSSLQELSRLRHNTNLQEIDLRLNPVTKNKPDYRLYLVHMLPNLRKLDDRSVRESERKSALLHFDTDQATGMTEHSASPARDSVRGELPRTKHVRGLGGRTVLEEDDNDLLDLLARTDGDLSRPRPITGSSVANSSVDVQLTQDYQRPYSQRTPPRRRAGSNTSSQMAERDRSVYQTDSDKQYAKLPVDSLPVLDTSTASDSTGSLLGADPLDQLNDSNLSAILSPLRPPDAQHSPKDPLTLHDNLPSPTDTNTIIEEIAKFPSDLWQPSDSLLAERKAFDLDHKDLLSPADTNSLVDGDGGAKFGKARLSFSPVDGRRKLDFDTLSEDSSVIVNKGALSTHSSLSMSTVAWSPRPPVDQDFDVESQLSATPRERSLIKAGDIYSSIMSQTRNRARTRGQTRSTSPHRSPGAEITSSGNHESQLTSPPISPVSLPVSPNPTDTITRTTSSSTSNKSHGSFSDRPPSSGSNISSESRQTQRQVGDLSDSSPHHVHPLLTPAPEPSQHLSDRERSQQEQQRSRVEVAEPEQEVRGRVDSNLKFRDESDAYAAYSSKVNFTPNPKSGVRADSSSYDMHPGSTSREIFDDPPPVQRTLKQGGTTSVPGMSQGTFLDSLLNLVDRYWNGSKSLHSHAKFQAQAQSLLEKLMTDHAATSQEHMDRLQLDVARYAQENVSLRNKLGAAGGVRGQQGTAGAGAELQRALDKSQRDVERLHLELQEVTEENRQLQVQLQDSRRKAADAASHSQGDVREWGQGMEKLQQENEKLRVQLKHVSQLQELATMLQESHKSLVTTNDHLLKELEETKQRHMEEVKQLHWSYNQLKQTMDITMPPSSSQPTSHHAPPQGSSATSQPGLEGGTINGYDRGEGSPPMQPGYGSYSPGKKVKGFSYSNGSM